LCDFFGRKITKKDMIKDELKNYSCYLNCNSRFEKAFEFLLKGDFECCRGKRFEIDGTNIYAESGEFKLRNLNDAPLEAHDKYIDIQYCIRGEEEFGWKSRENCKEDIPYNIERDIVFFEKADKVEFKLQAGQFVIFYPNDAHAPLIGTSEVEKCVVKVKL
jgi:YhcH/YjgK/YiaL family protein